MQIMTYRGRMTLRCWSASARLTAISPFVVPREIAAIALALDERHQFGLQVRQTLGKIFCFHKRKLPHG
jgi:hypothetical protein